MSLNYKFSNFFKILTSCLYRWVSKLFVIHFEK